MVEPIYRTHKCSRHPGSATRTISSYGGVRIGFILSYDRPWFNGFARRCRRLPLSREPLEQRKGGRGRGFFEGGGVVAGNGTSGISWFIAYSWNATYGTAGFRQAEMPETRSPTPRHYYYKIMHTHTGCG